MSGRRNFPHRWQWFRWTLPWAPARSGCRRPGGAVDVVGDDGFFSFTGPPHSASFYGRRWAWRRGRGAWPGRNGKILRGCFRRRYGLKSLQADNSTPGGTARRCCGKSWMPDSVETPAPRKHDVVGAVHQFLQPFKLSVIPDPPFHFPILLRQEHRHEHSDLRFL